MIINLIDVLHDVEESNKNQILYEQNLLMSFLQKKSGIRIMKKLGL